MIFKTGVIVSDYQCLDVTQMLSTSVLVQELQIPPSFNMYLILNKCNNSSHSLKLLSLLFL